MKRRPIHRGGILSAGYDSSGRFLDIEFDTKRILRVENIGPTAAERFLRSSSPFGYWKDEIEENYVVREISREESEREAGKTGKSLDDLKRLFGDL